MDVWLELTKGYQTVIDAEDAAKVAAWKWSADVRSCGLVYAVRGQYLGMTGGKPKYRRVYLHRVLMDAPNGVQVDHVNGDTLNNRRSSNLRLCTAAGNARNQRAYGASGFKGVFPTGNRWYAKVMKDRVLHTLGTFDTPEEAARAYDSAARELHGAFARLNFSEEVAYGLEVVAERTQ